MFRKLLLFPLKAVWKARVVLKIFKSKIVIGILIGLVLVVAGYTANKLTSTNEFCESCHVHPQATQSWRLSTHYDTKSGVIVRCVECHLPPGGVSYLMEKARLGIRDLFSKIFKDTSKIDWEEKSRLDHAVTYNFKESCVHCHQNLFPLKLTRKGDEAHLYYTQKPDQLR